MQLKWGNKNESLTLTVGSGGNYKTEPVTIEYDKMVLQLMAKQVCDIGYMKAHMAKRAAVAELEVRCLNEEIEKGKNLWRMIWRFIKLPAPF